ncbi:DUF2800 domain-containing protein [Neorhizobium galegae]|uniref:DUF2800 domain-containing protein n=1 Tax=Neorhizobium galegae TaxID=399 RepID=UPI0006224BD1|nr:DUF2800 domain-containing protein [Neorhizobium galegae]CDZ55045.1 PF10926 family protein [Neorhizobium galegae bv. orientalis]
MVDHSARDHATWSASSTDRNWNCSGALALTMDLPETTNEAADWGTCCHQIAEKCLRKGVQAVDFIGTTEKGKKHEFEVDEEMAETAQMYVDYVRKRVVEAAPKGVNPATLLQIEQRFSLADLSPPFEAGGTGDAVIYFPAEKMIEVVDLKGGRGVVVEAKGNPQLRTYGLGAILANPKLLVEQVRVTIVQSRAGHKDGRIRDETFHVADLAEWTADLLRQMHKSKMACDEFADVLAGKIPVATWEAKWLKAGDHCKFCKKAGNCSAQTQEALDAAGVWFDDLDQPRLSNSPDMLSPERAAQLLDAADMISEWVNSVRAYWHLQAEAGVEIPNYILVPKEGREKFNDDASAKLAAAKAEKAGLPKDKVWNDPKPRTPKQIRDALIKAKKPTIADELRELSGAEAKGTNLVRATKTTRAAVAPAAHRHFDILD